MKVLKASLVIAVAKREVGYLEKRSNKDLDSKTANAGSGNYTKYGRWYGDNPDYWCAMFVCWCFAQALGYEAGKKALYGVYSAACETLRQNFIRHGAYYHTPQVGDCIFFTGTRHGGANHIGIVYAVKNGYVYTIEGNTSGGSTVIDNGGGVAYKSYRASYSRIMGYGRPNYGTAGKNAVATAQNAVTDILGGLDMPTIKKGSKGKAVRVWQSIIGFTGSDIDGDFGTNTEKKTIAFQKKKFPNQKSEWDGIVGSKTWRAGLESV